MQFITGLRFVERNQKRILQQRTLNIRHLQDGHIALRSSEWEDVSLQEEEKTSQKERVYGEIA